MTPRKLPESAQDNEENGGGGGDGGKTQEGGGYFQRTILKKKNFYISFYKIFCKKLLIPQDEKKIKKNIGYFHEIFELKSSLLIENARAHQQSSGSYTIYIFTSY